MCPISPWPPGWLLPGGEEVWGERDRPGDTYSELLCVISHVSTPPKPSAERDGEGGLPISARQPPSYSAARGIASPGSPTSELSPNPSSSLDIPKA